MHIPRVPGPQIHQTILITILWGLVAKIIIWENWFCLFAIWNIREIVYPKGPETPRFQNHINYYALGLGGLDYHLGELNLFAYQ